MSAFSIKKETAIVEVAFQQALNDISKQREEIISAGLLNDAIRNNDLSRIAILIQAEVEKRNLGFIVITDKDGFVLERSGLSVQQGDNIFQTMIQGKSVALGQTVTVIDRSTRYPLTAFSSSYIFEQNKPIGSILVGRIFDTEYADYFQKEYLGAGGQIVFYTPQEGIVSDSFEDKAKTQLISSYFSLGSDLVAQNLAGLSKEIKIENNYYVIRHIIFPGTEESPGGAFVFFPISHNLYSLFLTGIMTLLFIILLFILFYKFLNHHFKFCIHHKKYTLIFFLSAPFVLFVAFYFATLIKLDNSAIELRKSPYLIYNSTIKFEPDSDVISQFSEKTIAIKVFTGGEAINVVNAIVHYNTTTIAVLDISTKNSLCDPGLFIEKENNTEKGEIRIICGVPNPGFYDPVGTVAEITVQPLSAEPIYLDFTEETQVLANDGLGTNVLRVATNGFYQVVRQKFATADIISPLPIFSPSHPNSNRWYNNKNIKLSWPKLLGGTYYYTLNHSPNSSAQDKISSTTNNYVDISVDNGINYFHLQAKDAGGGLGVSSSFKIMVDTVPPSSPKIKTSSETIGKGEIVRMDFVSKDALSGLQSGFYVKIDEGILLPVKPPFYIPFIKKGEYSIVIRVFDKANNFSDSKTVIHVTD